ncbi:MAG: LamG domain-containing protein [Verrucomicrobia bacterium]|nr:LamG domain-containing protein [Verrucomicrobiota bacterium]
MRKKLSRFAPQTRRGLGALALLLALSVAQAALTHRYSFNDPTDSTNAVDTVSGATGDLYPGASYPGDGTVWLNGMGGFVYLPDDLISDYTSITFEVWTTPESHPAWARLIDFGTSTGGKGAGGDGLTWTFITLNANGGYQGNLNGDGANQWVTGSQPAPGELHHLVFTVDADAQTAALYDNGVQVAFARNFTMTPQRVGPTYNNFIGRSQFAADAYYAGAIDELRIYNHPVDLVQVAANYEAGPESLTGAAGDLTAIQFNNAPNVFVNSRTPPSLLATYTGLTNPVNIATLPGIVYTSSDPAVAVFDADGNIHAVGLGTTMLQAEYQSLVTTLELTVGSEPVVLLHRYSFDGAPESTTITDSVGGANGTLINQSDTAGLTGTGQLNLDGNLSTAYVALPPGMVGSLTNATFQIWVNGHDAYSSWAELLTFGRNNDGVGDRFFNLIPNNPVTGKLRLDFNAATLDAPTPLPLNQDCFVTITYDYTRGTASIFMDGRKVASGPMTGRLFELPDEHNYIGQSQWYGLGDPYFNGTLDELRIYSGVPSDLQIAIDAAAGPDALLTDPGALKSITVVMPSTSVDVHSAGVPVQVLADFENISGVDVATLAQTTISSSDPSVGTIAAAVFVPREVGGAVIFASYGGLTSTLNVSVEDPEGWPYLLHRYTFNETSGTTLHDSVGSIDGTIHGPVTLTGSRMITPAGNPPPVEGQPTPASGWVSFPAWQGLVTGLPNQASIECWVVFHGGAVWQEIYDFGVAATPGMSLGGGNYIMLCPRDGINGSLRMEWFPGGLVLTGPGMPENVLCQVVVTHDQDRQLDKLYFNGQLIASGHNNRLWSDLGDQDNWLARDQWPDAMFNGAYDELRFWNGALTPGQVANLYAAGPDVIPGPALRIAAAGNQLTLKWPANATGFNLESTTDLSGGTWTPVAGTVNIAEGLASVTLPISATPTYYRLKQ